MAIRILIHGSNGRMGVAIKESCDNDPDVVASAGVDLDTELTLDEAIDHCDAVIDFSLHSITSSVVESCLLHQKKLVIGTTGHDDAELAAIREASEKLPIVFAPNYSVGVNTLFWLTRRATEILGTEFDLEVIEMHHRHKVDAPSGTARRLAEVLAEVRELDYAKDMRHGREGIVGARTTDEIGIHSMRGGDVVGDHTVVYANNGERVELTHKASSRSTFANGSVRAAKWVQDKPPGLYDMQDVLGLK
ncbi:MAG: 4-hydroxy-tetrahydrodipicolinate reductase [Verrucomicrobiota bacterium]